MTTDLVRPSLEEKPEYKGIARWKNPEEDGSCGWAAVGGYLYTSEVEGDNDRRALFKWLTTNETKAALRGTMTKTEYRHRYHVTA